MHGIHDEFSHDQLKRGERLFYGLIPMGEDARSCADCHNTDEHSKSAGIPAAGVCVNCHRDKEVQFIDNAFYEKYEKLHQELKSGKRDRVSVEDIGGIECMKCHY